VSGKFFVLRRTTKKRLRAKLQVIKTELRLRRHDPVPEVGAWLRRVVQGYFNYHAVPCNLSRLRSFRTQVIRHW
jgi:RNA-directed DNA polymerase